MSNTIRIEVLNSNGNWILFATTTNVGAYIRKSLREALQYGQGAVSKRARALDSNGSLVDMYNG
jgi:hypothetical protein